MEAVIAAIRLMIGVLLPLLLLPLLPLLLLPLLPLLPLPLLPLLPLLFCAASASAAVDRLSPCALLNVASGEPAADVAGLLMLFVADLSVLGLAVPEFPSVPVGAFPSVSSLLFVLGFSGSLSISVCPPASACLSFVPVCPFVLACTFPSAAGWLVTAEPLVVSVTTVAVMPAVLPCV